MYQVFGHSTVALWISVLPNHFLLILCLVQSITASQQILQELQGSAQWICMQQSHPTYPSCLSWAEFLASWLLYSSPHRTNTSEQNTPFLLTICLLEIGVFQTASWRDFRIFGHLRGLQSWMVSFMDGSLKIFSWKTYSFAKIKLWNSSQVST